MRPRLERLVRELAKFGAVGALGFLVNVAIFNLCIHTFQLAPIRSGVVSQVVAIGTNYLGNRYWTYRHIDKNQIHRETVLFFFFSGIGLVLENGILALSHYGFGYTSPLADNISKNVIGLAIGTVFRFWAYRTWVFRVGAQQAQGGSGAGEGTGDEADDEEPARAGTEAGTEAPNGHRTPAQSRGGSAAASPASGGVRLTRARSTPAASGSRGVRGVEVGGLAAEEQREDRRKLLK
ncbi:GtrA family protein [Streptomyces tubbatahanensis]|uniref:GtrA family protein n=1 Tax=Streptomyces tubbatahanensis TaxID=2923272 RepID=A0ABY3XSG3_9ACTN|nr:GtrA family protein [Streptomyces tubbatahanensis]UNS97381.1 GtrA family protein [Streptomyces tubbatahanensis]